MKIIPFNKPFLTGKETTYINQAVQLGELSGEGQFGKKCEKFLEGFLQNRSKVLLTPSCTAALELISLLLELKEGDEVILPSFTFVTTASAFVMRGAKPVFADIDPITLNILPSEIERLITDKTKAVVIVHYAGWPCDMESILDITKKHNLVLIEDAAHALGSSYKERQIGTFGDFATFSFHETKNVTCGEGGALVVNNEKYLDKAYIIRDKGTNRRQFQRGDVAFYSWVDLGSSYVMSDVLSAFLMAQLENISQINSRRREIHSLYYHSLKSLLELDQLFFPTYIGNSDFTAHLFFILLKDEDTRKELQNYLKSKNIYAVFHYQPLHLSPFVEKKWGRQDLLVNCENITRRLLRLPMHNSLSEEEVLFVADEIENFFVNK